MRTRAAALAATAIVLATAAPAGAAPKAGCSSDASLWARTTVDGATTAIWPNLLDPAAFGTISGLRAAIDGYDRNGDDLVCLLTMWGDHLNQNSHWYLVGIEILGEPTQQFFIRDNTANAAP